MTAIVNEGADATPFRARDKDVADANGAALNENGGDSSAAFIKFRFNDHPLTGTIGIGAKFKNFRLKQNRLFKLGKSGALGRGNFNILDIAAHFLDDDFMLQQFVAHAIRICVSMHLLIAIMIGTSAAFAWAMASTVCGFLHRRPPPPPE